MLTRDKKTARLCVILGVRRDHPRSRIELNLWGGTPDVVPLFIFRRNLFRGFEPWKVEDRLPYSRLMGHTIARCYHDSLWKLRSFVGRSSTADRLQGMMPSLHQWDIWNWLLPRSSQSIVSYRNAQKTTDDIKRENVAVNCTLGVVCAASFARKADIIWLLTRAGDRTDGTVSQQFTDCVVS